MGEWETLEMGKGMVDIDGDELAIRIFEAISGKKPPPGTAEQKLSFIYKHHPNAALIIEKASNTAIDYFAECVQNYARMV
jgi:hypothetical protein